MASQFFERSEKRIPMRPTSQIVRVDMDQIDLGGRKSFLSSFEKSTIGEIEHFPNRDGKGK